MLNSTGEMDLAEAAACENGVFVPGPNFSSGGDGAANHQVRAVIIPYTQLGLSGGGGCDYGGRSKWLWRYRR